MAQETQHLALLALAVDIPSAPGGWYEYTYAVLMDGTLALLRTDRDIRTELAAWYGRVSAGDQQALIRLTSGAVERGCRSSTARWSAIRSSCLCCALRLSTDSRMGIG